MILTSQGDLDKENRNHLLYEFRLNYHSDKWAQTTEWLFQLARHWALWQDRRIGTFPLAYTDRGGVASREVAEATGEDATYYSIDEIIKTILEERGCEIRTDKEGQWIWVGDDMAPARFVQDMIVHTTSVLMRLDYQLDQAGLSY